MQIVSFSFPEILPFCVVGGPLSWSEGQSYSRNPTGCKFPYNFIHPDTGCGDFAKSWHQFLVESGLLRVAIWKDLMRVKCVHINSEEEEVIQSERNEWLWFRLVNVVDVPRLFDLRFA